MEMGQATRTSNWGGCLTLQGMQTLSLTNHHNGKMQMVMGMVMNRLDWKVTDVGTHQAQVEVIDLVAQIPMVTVGLTKEIDSLMTQVNGWMQTAMALETIPRDIRLIGAQIL
jgi:hypothetical protein